VILSLGIAIATNRSCTPFPEQIMSTRPAKPLLAGS
jgi:hypothetical protein